MSDYLNGVCSDCPTDDLSCEGYPSWGLSWREVILAWSWTSCCLEVILTGDYPGEELFADGEV